MTVQLGKVMAMTTVSAISYHGLNTGGTTAEDLSRYNQPWLGLDCFLRLSSAWLPIVIVVWTPLVQRNPVAPQNKDRCLGSRLLLGLFCLRREALKQAGTEPAPVGLLHATEHASTRTSSWKGSNGASVRPWISQSWRDCSEPWH